MSDRTPSGVNRRTEHEPKIREKSHSQKRSGKCLSANEAANRWQMERIVRELKIITLGLGADGCSRGTFMEHGAAKSRDGF